MQARFLNNYGFIEDRIPTELYEKLVCECSYAEKNNPELITDLTSPDVPTHRNLVDTKDDLNNYIKGLFNFYNINFPGLYNVKVFTKSLPFHFGTPWINFQRKGQYVPNHTHDGVYSYSLWIKIPSSCKFQFTYTNVIGNLQQHTIQLTKDDEGKIVFFPARLPHIAYPFNDSDEVRISISGNISFNSDNI